MKRFTRTISMIVTMSLVNLFVVIPALALPPIPSSFYGTVKVDGVNVADGIIVQALINGQVYAQSVTQTYQGNSVYALDVPGDDTDTPAVDGGHDGDIIQFKIGGNLASQTGIWKSGINISLNLTRTNAKIGEQEIHAFIDELKIRQDIRDELKQITPFNYTGI